jgi:hypothetical protein
MGKVRENEDGAGKCTKGGGGAGSGIGSSLLSSCAGESTVRPASRSSTGGHSFVFLGAPWWLKILFPVVFLSGGVMQGMCRTGGEGAGKRGRGSGSGIGSSLLSSCAGESAVRPASRSAPGGPSFVFLGAPWWFPLLFPVVFFIRWCDARNVPRWWRS